MTAALPDIGDVVPAGEADEALFRELREVLVRHASERRFGLVLLHQHFDLTDDEILVETVDVASRTLTVRPAPLTSLESTSSIATNWRLDDARVVQKCVQVCPGGSSTDHQGWPSHQNL